LLEGESYLSTRIQLAPGDTLLLYTDGITEAEDKDRQLFQDDRLKQVFSQYRDASLQDLQNGIVRAIDQFTGGTSQSDDVTLLVVRYSDARGDGSQIA
jgi:sigma-B regulation protein RsbU (phosphoserine phosphatase)